MNLLRRTALPLPTAALVAALAGCATSEPLLRCAAGEEAVRVHTLYFGRHSAQGPVTEADWQAFVDAEVTPRFMDGLTAWAARGQWRDIHTARIVREDSVVLQLVVPAHKDARGALRDIVAAYKARFRQQAVLQVVAPGCSSL